MIDELIDLEQFKEEEKGAITGQVMDTEQRGTIYVVKKGAEYWKEILAFSQPFKILSPKEESILGVACAIPYKIPSDKQSKIILDIEKKVIQDGFISKNDRV